MNQEEKILGSWLEGNLSEQEVREQLSVETTVKYKQILDAMDQLVPDLDNRVFDPQIITEQPKEIPLNQEKSETITHQINWWRPMAVAASILLIMVVGVLLLRSTGEQLHQTLAGEQRQILLPDQTTTVTLAANSALSWSSDDWDSGIRKVNLDGQAYFNVTEKGAFEVVTEMGAVNVLGTQFNVDQTEDLFVVSCYEGKVKAKDTDGNGTEVMAGQITRLVAGKWEPLTEIDQSLPGWMKEWIIFNNAPLDEVISKLSSSFGLEIDHSAISTDRRLTGTIPNDTLDVALKIVFDPLNIQYELKGNQLILSE